MQNYVLEELTRKRFRFEPMLRDIIDIYDLSEECLKESPKELATKVDKMVTSEIISSIYHELGHGKSNEQEIFPEELFIKILNLARETGSAARSTKIKHITMALSDVLADTIDDFGRLAHIIKDKNTGALGFFTLRHVSSSPIFEYQDNLYSHCHWDRLFLECYRWGKWPLIEEARKSAFEGAAEITARLKELDINQNLKPGEVEALYKEFT